MAGRAWYNDSDPFVAEWLRRLVAAGHLPEGDVDDRPIAAVRAGDLAGYTACHFFAGIGGWPLALALAGWPDDREVWTGSCPCQPFSTAGRRRGASDERHLWPVWRDLIGERHPRILFGEQVEAAIAYEWLCVVRAELEDLGYAVAPVSLCAASVGAPHIRSRIFFVADADRAGCRPRTSPGIYDARPDAEPRGHARGGLVDADRERRIEDRRDAAAGYSSSASPAPQSVVRDAGAARDSWRGCDWITCRDGVTRPIEPGTFPLAHGVPARVGRLRAYGNALVPPLAAEVVGAYLDLEGGLA
jgi:DNA (cytosine-5)-methyltransferase 1